MNPTLRVTRTAMRYGRIAIVMCCVGASSMAEAVAQGGSDQQLAAGPAFLTPRQQRGGAGGAIWQDASDLPVLKRRIALVLYNMPLGAALDTLGRRADLKISYSSGVIRLRTPVNLNAPDITVGAAFSALLYNAAVDVLLTPSGQVAIVKHGTARMPTGTIVGRLTDGKSGAAVSRAEVLLGGTHWQTTTDTSGWYRLADVDTGQYTLTVRRLGYRKQSRTVTVREGQTDTVHVALEPVATRLDELVTTATGRRRRLEIANDITTLNADSIVRTQPITSVTDLLEGRVPGLTVQRTSGAPGDPARLRLRGAGSPLRSNDPIVVVDGVRIYAEQSAARNINLAAVGDTTRSAKNAYATPSPLDYLDPNSIETIEVVKGPSAATLYGQDAANGVIVITTKKGKAGPTRWIANAEHGQSRIAGDYPELLLRWGHPLTSSARVPCRIDNTSALTVIGVATATCEGDSVVTFQLLNDPALTVLDRGRHTALSLTASGGSTALTYAVTGSYRHELGLPKLPGYEAESYQARTGTAVPEWMRRPQSLTQWGVTSRFGARLGATADLALATTLSRTVQQRSSLEQQLGTLMSTYLDQATGTYYQGYLSGFSPTMTVLTNYYERATDAATAFTSSLGLTWRPRSWLTFAGDAGLNLNQRADEIFLPRGAAPVAGDSTGHFNTGQGSVLTSTVDLRANAQAPIGRGFLFRFATGVNYTGTATNDLSTQTYELAPGTSTRGALISGLTPRKGDNATFGWYVAPSLGNQRFNIDLGLRLDGGGLYGNGVKGLSLPKFPKMGFSYLVSDEPFFPFKDLFQSFRVRVAYGRASRQPGLTDRLRLYGSRQPLYTDGGPYVGGVFLQSLGNTQVRPERSTEFEGGFDADFWQSRINVSVSGYRKTTDDALLSVPLPPSVYGDGVSVVRNIGVVRNTGLEFTLNGQWVRSGPVTWGTQLSVSQSRNVVVRLGTGVEPFYIDEGIRIAAGYPLFGRWSQPILGYADGNGDGVLQRSEIQLGDTAIYVGQTAPDYTASLHTTVSFWRGALAVSAGLQHDHGLAQKNEVARQLAPFSRGWNDPTASLAEQAATVDLQEVLSASGNSYGKDYNWIQTLSTTRFNTLSVSYRVPVTVARRLGAQELHVMVQGTNLGLWTDYRGLDPNVNAFSTGNNVTDTGILPQPRTWQLRVDASY